MGFVGTFSFYADGEIVNSADDNGFPIKTFLFHVGREDVNLKVNNIIHTFNKYGKDTDLFKRPIVWKNGGSFGGREEPVPLTVNLSDSDVNKVCE